MSHQVPSLFARFIEPEPNSGCWLWVGAIGRGGYGRAWMNGKNYQAHRALYELLRGEIPKPLTIDHLCRVRSCVNPSHLEAVTLRENLLRGDTFQSFNAAKSVCGRGHQFSHRDKLGYRQCVICQRASSAARQRRSRARRKA